MKDKVELTYAYDGFGTSTYEVTEDTMKSYIKDWCEGNLEIISDKSNLIEFLESEESYDYDWSHKHAELIDTQGIEEVLTKCIKLANDYRQSETEVSRNNSETE